MYRPLKKLPKNIKNVLSAIILLNALIYLGYIALRILNLTPSVGEEIHALWAISLMIGLAGMIAGIELEFD